MSARTRRADARAFRAMGSIVILTAVDLPDAALDEAANHAQAFAEIWESRFSRFRPASELSRLNRAGAAETIVSDEFLAVLEAAADACERTGGLFNPAILPALERLGYDRDFALVPPRSSGSDLPPINPVQDWLSAIAIDRASNRVVLPPGCQLDFGGIAKGIFVDRLAEQFADWPGGCVSAGGDLRVWGSSPDGDYWVVGIEDPTAPNEDICLISITGPEAAAVATSATNRRAWWSGPERMHHLIDPATGRPVLGALASATALAPTLALAEPATKALLVSSGRGEALQPADASLAVVVDVSKTSVVIEGRHPHACVVHSNRPSRGAA